MNLSRAVQGRTTTRDPVPICLHPVQYRDVRRHGIQFDLIASSTKVYRSRIQHLAALRNSALVIPAKAGIQLDLGVSTNRSIPQVIRERPTRATPADQQR